tara:strand:- start:2140 stop:2442 length:303 start_codon:yes stop_codon:yes gene_type:complete
MYRPLPDLLTISKSSIDGLGVTAAIPLEPNLELGISHIKDSRFENGYSRTPLGGFINHADDPNCEVYKDGDFLKLRTIKKIEVNTELTLSYALYEVKLTT